MRDDLVIHPENQVAQADGTSSSRPRHKEVFTASHGKEETKEVVLLKSNQEGAGGGTRAHAEDLINGNALLVASAAINILVAPVQAEEEDGCGAGSI